MTVPAPAPTGRARLLGGLAGAAVAVGVVTALSRAVGAVRVAVLGQTVGPTCLGDTYVTANQIPNVVFEVVAGGALASVVVPLLAGPLAAGDAAAARRTASALLTWALLLLAPLALLLALAARPAMALLLGDGGSCDRLDQLAVGARMLVVFAPQVVLYGVAIVLGGVLQAHRRFLGPALAPLLSSLVVITAYLAYAALAARGEPLEALGPAEELVLSVGTTLGVAVLALSLLVPLRGTGLRLRPALTFPPGVARRARGLAAAGAAVLVTQQLSVVVALRLLNDEAPPGSVVLFALATTVFTVPWAVLAVPVATSVFPRLSALAEVGDGEAYADTLARASRAVVLVSAVGATVLAVVAGPAARVLVLTAPGREGAEERLADALVTLAPGLVGYGLVALLGRALYARGAARVAAVATGAGWLAVAVADVTLVALLPAEDAVAAVGLGNTVGMTAAGVLLVLAVRGAAGPPALAGLGRAVAAAAPACLAGAAAGWAVVSAAGPRGVAGSLVTAAVAAAAVLVVAGAVLAALDRGRGELLPAVPGSRRPWERGRAGARRPDGPGEDGPGEDGAP